MKISPSETLAALERIPESHGIVIAFSDSSTFETYGEIFLQISKSHPKAKLLSLDYFFSKYLEGKKIDHDCIYNEQMSEEYAELYERSQELAQSWLKDPANGEDFVVHDGLRLGYCYELIAFDFFQAVLKCIADVEGYLKRSTPKAIFYFSPDSAENIPKEGSIDFDIFQNLLPYFCRKHGTDFVEIETPGSKESGSLSIIERMFRLSPPFGFLGKTLRLPQFLYVVLKNLYLFAKNLAAKTKLRSDQPNLWAASQSTLNYLGPGLVGRIIDSGKFNLFVWDGESKRPEVINVVPQFSSAFWGLRLKRIFLRRSFDKYFREARGKLKGSTCFRGAAISELCPDFFSNLYRNHFPAVAANAELIMQSLKKNKIGAIICHSDYSVLERMTILIGNKLSIPTINFQHGLEGTQLANTILGYPSIAEHNFVWGASSKAIKISKGVNESRIRVVGCPLYEFKNYGVEVEMRLDAPGTFLFICSTGGQYFCDNRMSYKDNEVQLNLLLETMKSFPAKTLVLKPRFPDPQVGIYRELIADSGISNVLSTDTPISVLLEECDLFFTTFSTSGLEGLILNKPGIQFMFPYDNKAPLIRRTGTRHIPFTDYGATLGLESPDPATLLDMIRSIYLSEEMRGKLREGRMEFLEDYANFGKGDPGDNYLKAVDRILESEVSDKVAERGPREPISII